MKVLRTKPSKYEQVAEILEKQGYILDDQSAKIFGNDKLYRVNEHVRIWKKLQSDREFFRDKKIYDKKKGHRCHLVKISKENDFWYKVGKEFYRELDLSK